MFVFVPQLESRWIALCRIRLIYAHNFYPIDKQGKWLQSGFQFIPSPSRGGLGWGWGKLLNLLATSLPHPPPDLPLAPQGCFLRGKGGGEDGAELCA